MVVDNTDNRLRSRAKKAGSGNRIFLGLGIIIIVLFAGVGSYIVKANTYHKRFLPNTIINGIDVSEKSADEVRAEIASQIEAYTLLVYARGQEAQTLSGSDIGLTYVFDTSLDQILEAQDIYTWFIHKTEIKEHKIQTVATYDEEKFLLAIGKLEAFDEETFVAPTDAYISAYEAGSYSIIPEVLGCTLDVEKAKTYILDAVLTLAQEVDLDAADASLYIEPAILATDENLLTTLQTLNTYVSTEITYEKLGTLDGDTIHTWIQVDGSSITLDETQITDYVNSIATAYNTLYKPKTLKTTSGMTVTITGGSYGWKVDTTTEASELKSLILAGAKEEREPAYSRTAASHGTNDYGDSYVEVNLTAQHLYLYIGGKMVLESDFVSGNVSKGWTTPAGVFPMTYKTRNATLTGEDYSTPVSYWMPFNGGIGFHDASWRSSFGGTIYKTSGSHGCINLPPSVAKTLYSYVDTGFPVLCYNLAGTESATTTNASGETQKAQTTVAETTVQSSTEVTLETTASETSPTETTAGVGVVSPIQTSAEETDTSVTESTQVYQVEAGPS